MTECSLNMRVPHPPHQRPLVLNNFYSNCIKRIWTACVFTLYTYNKGGFCFFVGGTCWWWLVHTIVSWSEQNRRYKNKTRKREGREEITLLAENLYNKQQNQLPTPTKKGLSLTILWVLPPLRYTSLGGHSCNWRILTNLAIQVSYEACLYNTVI